MKAIVQTKYGSPDVLQLEEVEKPTPKEDEVLIRIVATPATTADNAMLSGPYLGRLFGMGLTRPNNPIPGTVLAGVVEEAGKEVTLFREGDQVFGSTDLGFGCYAEYICLPEKDTLVNKPANMTYEEAAPVPVGGLEALHYIDFRQRRRAACDLHNPPNGRRIMVCTPKLLPPSSLTI